ncbi:MAG: S-type pyocin family protein [Brevundimonas sp.]|uniref:S-type pyocin family protein n=1 Tax=Brevundimonas sp. TaxID=1871086 RepID=UPI0025C48C31|nr:S-type pyocin family protein [Brevundimonas sp.]MBX3478159.1 S-type pyocin family protein [Brevundimonas sp.]
MTDRMMIAAALAVLGLAGCERSSAVETRDRGAEPAPAAALAALPAENEAAPPAEARPVLTANRRETTDAKIERLYRRNGAAFGARSAEDYLARVTAFTGNPPRDAEIAKRPNGDTLIYQASTNTFAVVARDGTPRTMFKPDDGAAYWADQKAKAPDFGRSRRSSGE